MAANVIAAGVLVEDYAMDPVLAELYRRLAMAKAYDEMDEYDEISREIEAYKEVVARRNLAPFRCPTRPGVVKNFNGIAA